MTLEIFNIEFDDQDHTELDQILQQSGGPAGEVFGLERDRNGRHGRIMKYNLNAKPNDQTFGSTSSDG
jgi:hypothetical protein